MALCSIHSVNAADKGSICPSPFYSNEATVGTQTDARRNNVHNCKRKQSCNFSASQRPHSSTFNIFRLSSTLFFTICLASTLLSNVTNFSFDHSTFILETMSTYSHVVSIFTLANHQESIFFNIPFLSCHCICHFLILLTVYRTMLRSFHFILLFPGHVIFMLIQSLLAH